jgi:hypothetical protein
MAIINKGKSFANGEQLTADKLNQVIDNATFTTSAVDNVSTQLSSGAIIVKDGGVTTAKLNDGGVTTAKLNDGAVTTAKITDANVTFAKLTDVIDDDTMATATDTTLATSESIKAYVDEYAMKYSGVTGTGLQVSGTATYRDLDLSSVVGANRALVIMELEGSSTGADIFFRTKGSTIKPVGSQTFPGWGASGGYVSGSNDGFTCEVTTDENGVLEYTGGVATGISYKIQAYQKLR